MSARSIDDPNPNVILTAAKALRARLLAGLGPVQDPRQALMTFHGIPYRIGETVRDTVTGEEVKVLGGTIIH